MDMVRVRMKDYNGTMILPGGRKLTPYDFQGIEISADIWDRVHIDKRLELVQDVTEEEVKSVTDDKSQADITKLKDRIKDKNKEISQLKTAVQELESKFENPIVTKANEVLNKHWSQVLVFIRESDDILLLKAIRDNLLEKQQEVELRTSEAKILGALMTKLAPATEASTEPVSLVGAQDANQSDQSEE